MNATANVAFLTLATGSIGTAVEMVKAGNYIGGGIMVVISVLLFLAYEKTPPTTPTV
jgi:hypothetical protein